jgi:hypothetical protein
MAVPRFGHFFAMGLSNLTRKVFAESDVSTVLPNNDRDLGQWRSPDQAI